MGRYVRDRMAKMYQASLVEVGKAGEVYFDPKHPCTETLISSNAELDHALERSRRFRERFLPANAPTGCRFANRCPKMMDVCRVETPRLIPFEDIERQLACHLY